MYSKQRRKGVRYPNWAKGENGQKGVSRAEETWLPGLGCKGDERLSGKS